MKTSQISIYQSIIDTQIMVKNPIAVFEKYRKNYGETFEFHFGGVRKTIVTSDPSFIKYLLKDNRENYHKSHIQVKRMVEFQGYGLANSHGDFWKRQRELLNMGFTKANLSKMLPLQLRILKDFMADFDDVVKSGAADMHNQMVKFTLRAVGKSLFGRPMKTHELEKIANAISEIQGFIVKKVIQPYLFPWYAISGQNRKYQAMRVACDQIVENYIQQRKKDIGNENDILQILLETPYQDNGELMDDKTILIEIMQLLVAGNETSTTAASWTFYELAKHSEHIQAIRKEINEIFGDGEIDYLGLRKLKYTANVLNEAIRLHPPFWMIDRETLADDEFNGVKIPKGTIVVPYIFGAHHNEKEWKNPYNFNPSRFEKENRTHAAFAFIPFGGGPRVCIGQNMARIQILLVMCAIIRKYDFKLKNDVTIGHQAKMILKADAPIELEFTPVD